MTSLRRITRLDTLSAADIRAGKSCFMKSPEDLPKPNVTRALTSILSNATPTMHCQLILSIFPRPLYPVDSINAGKMTGVDANRTRCNYVQLNGHSFIDGKMIVFLLRVVHATLDCLADHT